VSKLIDKKSAIALSVFVVVLCFLFSFADKGPKRFSSPSGIFEFEAFSSQIDVYRNGWSFLVKRPPIAMVDVKHGRIKSVRWASNDRVEVVLSRGSEPRPGHIGGEGIFNYIYD
jgi:hypothetical protein